MMKNTTRIAIIGGGIGGLAAAFKLKKLSDSGEGLEVSLFESGGRCGGKVMSERKDGFLCEYGPNSLLDNKPTTMALCDELGLKQKILRSNDASRKRYIFSQNKLHKLPEDPISFFASGLMTTKGKIRLMAELWTKKGDMQKDESIEEFARRRMGGEAYEKLLDPMISGIFAGDPSKMSLKTSFLKVHDLEDHYGGLIKGMFALMIEKRKQGKKMGASAGPGGTIVSFKDGLQELVDALALELKGKIHLNTKITAIKKERDEYLLSMDGKGALEKAAFDKVILCAPTYTMVPLFRDLNGAVAKELEKIPYAPVSVVTVGYNKSELSNPLDGFGFLIPFKEGRDILGCLWTSSIFKHRAPDGKALLTVMVGGARKPSLTEKSDAELLALVQRELKITMGITAAPIFSNIYKHKHAIIQFNVGHEKISNVIKEELKKLPGIYLGGNTYGGIGIDGAIKNSIDTAVASTKA